MYYDNALRINLKPDSKDRKELIDFCLGKKEQQYVAIGWSYIYEKPGVKISDYKSYYYAVKEDVRRINHAHNVFWNVQKDDLFWTRDLDGEYWICRCLDEAKTLPEIDMSVEEGIRKDIGAVVPVKAFCVGTQVPGEIKASFNRPNGGIIQEIKDDLITKYAKIAYNKKSGENAYEVVFDEQLIQDVKNSVVRNLPDFELEELVMTYLQIKYNYYLLSNSIANKSTTIKIEGEFISRDPEHPEDKAVVQVKGPKHDEVLSANNFRKFIDENYKVFLYAPECDDCGEKNVTIISEEELKQFYYDYRAILPKSITDIEDMILG